MPSCMRSMWRRAGIKTSITDAIAEFAREKHITQVIFGRSAAKGLKKYLYLLPAHRFLRESPEVDCTSLHRLQIVERTPQQGNAEDSGTIQRLMER